VTTSTKTTSKRHPVFNKKTLAYTALILAHLIWGANFVAAKITLHEIPVMTLAFLRYFLALMLLVPFILFEKKSVRIEKKDISKMVMMGICVVTLNIAFMYEGLKYTTVTDASVLSMIVPVVSVVLGWVFLKEKVYIINIVGIIFGFLGTIVILGSPSLLSEGFKISNLLGNTLMIISGLFATFGLLLMKQLLAKYSIVTLTFYAFLMGAVTFLIPATIEFFSNSQWISQVTILGILGLSYIVILSSICAFFLMEWGMAEISLSHANTFHYIEPLLATSLGVILLGEYISYGFIIGAILIGLGMYWGTLGKEAHHRRFKAHRH
jgi:drug/metabolite transporter (DMT)-like permease